MAGAAGPDSFDCWGLVRYIYRQHYGLEVPAVNVNPDSLRDVLVAFKRDPAFQAFEEVKSPQDGDVVLMRQSKYPVHAGMWLAADGGGVLHCCREGGVVFQDLPSLYLCGWRIDSYYRAKR